MPYDLTLSVPALFELLLAWLAVYSAVRMPGVGRAILVRFRVAGLAVERSRWRLMALSGVVPVALRLLLLGVDPAPSPAVMEEFSHLLQADTYAHARLTNPVHPLAAVLQSYQTIEWPHHMSVRPPLAAVFLWVGQIVFGSPFLGNLLSVGLAVAALSWTLLEWVPRGWAAIGSFAIIASLCLFGYWTNSYWCPATMVIGGALLLGVVPRAERRVEIYHGALFVVGLVLLAGTRPYEGGIFAAVTLGWLAVSLLRARSDDDRRRAIVLFFVPIALGGLAIVAAQCLYDMATTGNYRLLPYSIWRTSQTIAPTFLWQPYAAVPLFYHSGAKVFAFWEVMVVNAVTSGRVFGGVLLIARYAVTFRDVLGPFLFLPLLCWAPPRRPRHLSPGAVAAGMVACWLTLLLLFIAWGWAGAAINLLVLCSLLMRWLNRRERLLVLLVISGIVSASLPSFYMNVYSSVFAVPLLVLAIRGLHNLSLSHHPGGRNLAGFLLLGLVAMPVVETAAFASGHPLYGPSMGRFDAYPVEARRIIASHLAHMTGRHVVFVRTNGMSSSVDPVWNGADVDAQTIVWVRDINPKWTAAAQRYYRGRRMWLVTFVRPNHLLLTHYPANVLPAPSPLPLPNADRAAAEHLGAVE